jgi:ATP synthase protein I
LVLGRNYGAAVFGSAFLLVRIWQVFSSMSENGRDRDGTGGPRGDGLSERLRGLDRALQKARASKPGGEEQQGTVRASAQGMAQALKLSSEFIAGIAVGAGLGWLVDYLAGSTPWGLIVFLLLGFAAGVLNVLRSVGMVAPSGPPEDKA